MSSRARLSAFGEAVDFVWISIWRDSCRSLTGQGSQDAEAQASLSREERLNPPGACGACVCRATGVTEAELWVRKLFLQAGFAVKALQDFWSHLLREIASSWTRRFKSARLRLWLVVGAKKTGSRFGPWQLEAVQSGRRRQESCQLTRIVKLLSQQRCGSGHNAG